MKEFLRLPWGGHEVGGVLFGARHPDCLRIVAYRLLSCEHTKGPGFELSENDKARLSKLLEEAQKDEDLAGLQPVGWYHTKYRTFELTRDDLEIYNSFFPRPWQVAMVFQRGKGEPCVVGFFSRREDGSLHAAHRKFTVIEERPEVQPEPRVQEATTRSTLSDPILAGSGVAEPPKASGARSSPPAVLEPEKSPQPQATHESETTRSLLLETIPAGPGIADPLTPPATSTSLPAVPESVKARRLEATHESVTTRPLPSETVLAGPSIAELLTDPAANSSPPAAPESEKASPTETTQEPVLQIVPTESFPGGVHTGAQVASQNGGDGLSPVRARRRDSSPLEQRPEYQRVLQYLDSAPGAPPQLLPSVEDTLAQLSYCAFFGLRKNPFSQGSIPAFPYWSPQHKEILAGLRYGVQTRKGLMVVTGESGTGKTMLLQCLAEFLTAQSIEFAFLLNGKLTTGEFYEMVDYDLELGCQPPSKPNVLQALSRLLDARAMQDKTTVLIIDDAQNLEGEALEGIQQWASLHNTRGRLLQTVLCGFPELERKLAAENLRALKQRVALRCHLQPFTEDETMQYIAGQLTKAGMAKQTIFEGDVMAKIHLRSGGLLRVINLISDKLLEKCFEAQTKAATIGMLNKVSKELQLKTR